MATADYLRDIRAGSEISFFIPFWREFLSALVILSLIPGIIYLNRKFSFRVIGIPTYFAIHLLLSIPFTFIHVYGTIIMRLANDLIHGAVLNFGYIFQNLGFEYPKDLIVYVLILFSINFYTWLRRSLGKADKVKIAKGIIPVKTFSGVALLKAKEVEWIEAARNYVILHIGRNEYFIRAPMKEIETQFQKHGFLRIHRSFLINLAKVKEIMKSPPRDSQAVLVTGKKINIGRQYKQALDKNLGLENQK